MGYLFDRKRGGWFSGYTVSERGTVTIPSEIRRKYGLRKVSRVKFIETDGGMLIVPMVPLEELYGTDKDRKEVVYRMIRELQNERRKKVSTRM